MTIEANTSNTRYVILQATAAHCSYQGSNKDWVGVLVHVVDWADPLESPKEPPDAVTWMFLSAYGKSGGRLQGGEPTALLTRDQAVAQYNAKVNEKLGRHHYVRVPFEPFLSAFKLPLQWYDQPLASQMSDRAPLKSQDDATSAVQTQTPQQQPAPTMPALGYDPYRVEAVPSWYAYCTAQYGITEKANGERCLLSFDGKMLAAFNRRGVRVTPVPEAAEELRKLPKSFVIDGERLTGGQAGQFVAFDLLEWNGEDLTGWPYSKRIVLLQQVMQSSQLIKVVVATPTILDATNNSRVPGLALLSPVKGNSAVTVMVNTLREQGHEGIILRDLSASYQATKAVLKYKFTADIDAVVIGIKPGAGGGSIKLGLRRPSDHAILECGHVRSGLTTEDMRFLTDQLIQGIFTVLKVEYLPARTIGLSVVEGRTSRQWIRTDKPAWECTTDQLGGRVAHLVKRAKPVPGITFSAPSKKEMSEDVLTPPQATTQPVEERDEAAQRAAAGEGSLRETEQEVAFPLVRETSPNTPCPEIPGSQDAPRASSPTMSTSSALVLPESGAGAFSAASQAQSGVLLPLYVCTAADEVKLSECMEMEQTMLIDVRSKNILRRLATTHPTSSMSQQTLREKWGMRYLYLGYSLGNAYDLTWRSVQLTRPGVGVQIVKALLSQGYTLLLVCSCQPTGGHLSQILNHPPIRLLGARVLTSEALLIQRSAPVTEEVLPA